MTYTPFTLLPSAAAVWGCLHGSVNLAQIAAQGGGSPVDTSMIGLFGNLGVMGILVWHMWYHTTRTYPTMLERFSSELQRLRDGFDREQAAARDAFGREQAAIRQFAAQENGELRGLLIQSLQAHRTAVHDVRDAAQATMRQVANVMAVQQQQNDERGKP